MPPAESVNCDDADTGTPLPEIVWIEPVIPPNVSPDIAFLAAQQARQHFDRRLDSRATAVTIMTSGRRTNRRLDKLETALESKPGKPMVGAIMLFAGGVFLFTLIAALSHNGIDTGAVTRDTTTMFQTITGAASGTAPAAPAPVSSPAPSAAPVASPAPPEGNGDPQRAEPTP